LIDRLVEFFEEGLKPGPPATRYGREQQN